MDFQSLQLLWLKNISTFFSFSFLRTKFWEEISRLEFWEQCFEKIFLVSNFEKEKEMFSISFSKMRTGKSYSLHCLHWLQSMVQKNLELPWLQLMTQKGCQTIEINDQELLRLQLINRVFLLLMPCKSNYNNF